MKKVFSILFVAFMSFTMINAQEKADVVLSNALQTAQKENKNVMVFFHASWCGWCKLMMKNMQADATKDYFSNNFVLASIDVQEMPEKKNLENPGGEELLEQYGGANSGVPFWVILDKEGNVLTNSLDDEGQNLGSPATSDEVAVFIAKLEKTTHIKPEEISAVKEVFTREN